MSDSLPSHGLQHPCQVPLSSTISQSLLKFTSIGWWCYLTISSFVAASSFFHHSFLASGSLPMNPLAHKGCKIIILICTRHRHWLKFFIDIIPHHVLPHEVGSIGNTSSREKGLPWWLSCKESVCQCRRHQFDPWVRKIPWWRTWQPTTAFFTRESHGQRSLVDYSPWGWKESDTTEASEQARR